MEITSRETFERLKSLPIFKGVVVTNSMEPLIMVGDKILVEVGATDIKRFDIVIVLLNGVLTCHYLWIKNRHITPILLQTRSLRYYGADFPVELSDYLGKVISHRLKWHQKFRIILRSLVRRK
jgi:signal peptidase I